MAKSLSANAGEVRDPAQSLGREDALRRARQPSPHACLENPTDRGAWWASPWGHQESDVTAATQQVRTQAGSASRSGTRTGATEDKLPTDGHGRRGGRRGFRGPGEI